MMEMVSLALDGLCSFLTRVSAISSIVIAIELLVRHCNKLKYRKKIVLVTNGAGAMDADDISDIVQKLKAEDIELVILYANPTTLNGKH